jgi:hypothetical protein
VTPSGAIKSRNALDNSFSREVRHLQGLLDAIDMAVSLHPRILLHGHEPLTPVFASLEMLAQLKTDLSWLRDQVVQAIHRGHDRAPFTRPT